MSITADEKAPLEVEPVDEMSVPSTYQKLAKSTWDTLDVQGSGFELLGHPIVSRLESQDVDSIEIQGEIKPREWDCDLEMDFNDDVIIYAKEKPELEIDFIDEFMIQTSADEISLKAARKNVEVSEVEYVDEISLKGEKRKYDDEYVETTTEKGKTQKLKSTGKYGVDSTSYKVTADKKYKRDGKSKRKDEESEVTESHYSKTEIVDIKKKEKRSTTKPRRRGEEESETTSEHLGKKDIVDVKHKKQKRTDSKPRRRGEEESETTSDHLAKKDIVDVKHKKQKRTDSKPRRRGEEESETTSDHLAKKDIVDVKYKKQKRRRRK